MKTLKQVKVNDDTIEVKADDVSCGLYVNGVCQGIVDVDNMPLSAYMKYIISELGGVSFGSNSLFLGGGAFILPNYFTQKGVNVDVFENNPAIINLAEDYFAWDNNTITEDAHRFQEFIPPSRVYGLIVLDCYRGAEYDKSLYTKDFFQEGARRLTPKGIFCVNLCPKEPKDISNIGLELHKVFKTVKVKLLFMDAFSSNPAQAVYMCSGPI